jgi:uncharacterized protein
MDLMAVRAVLAGQKNGSETGVPSPCRSVCRMNGSNGLCEGCFRTLDEIARWSGMDDDGRRGVWRQIEQRMVESART